MHLARLLISRMPQTQHHKLLLTEVSVGAAGWTSWAAGGTACGCRRGARWMSFPVKGTLWRSRWGARRRVILWTSWHASALTSPMAEGAPLTRSTHSDSAVYMGKQACGRNEQARKDRP